MCKTYWLSNSLTIYRLHPKQIKFYIHKTKQYLINRNRLMQKKLKSIFTNISQLVRLKSQ